MVILDRVCLRDFHLELKSEEVFKYTVHKPFISHVNSEQLIPAKTCFRSLIPGTQRVRVLVYFDVFYLTHNHPDINDNVLSQGVRGRSPRKR